MRWFVEGKQPYPTLTGRQQFYVDHRWFLQLDEALPRYKAPPAAGGNYPLTLSGGHTRWSIHAMWRDRADAAAAARRACRLDRHMDAERRASATRDEIHNDVQAARMLVVSSAPPSCITRGALPPRATPPRISRLRCSR
jgi:nitrate reductase alpha subunit